MQNYVLRETAGMIRELVLSTLMPVISNGDTLRDASSICKTRVTCVTLMDDPMSRRIVASSGSNVPPSTKKSSLIDLLNSCHLLQLVEEARSSVRY